MTKRLAIDDLPQVVGRYIENFPTSQISWFKTGGKADVLYRPYNIDDLSLFLQKVSKDIPLLVIGAGSNILIRDGGWPGVILELPFNAINKTPNNIIAAEASALGAHVASYALNNCIGGLEFMCGIPGSVGGAVSMNAGCYGKETKDVFVAGTFISLNSGEIHKLSRDEITFEYRSCPTMKGYALLSADFMGIDDTQESIARKMDDIKRIRRDSQPIGQKTCGSTFKNPDGHRAWQLIQQALCHNKRVGGATVSEKHSNFIINDNNATAKDIEELCEAIRATVQKRCGIDLMREIIIAGEHHQ